MKYIISVVLFLLNMTAIGQVDSIYLTVKIDSQSVQNNRYAIIVEQKGKIVKYGGSITIEKGKPFNVSIENISPKVKPLIGLVAFSDTVIHIDRTLLENVFVQSKKFMAVQTDYGFEYKPYLDSSYLKKTLYTALERMPFIVTGQDNITYKDNRKILFKINGKERPGINSWNEILKLMPAREIYSVKMITELPEDVKRRNYDIILDIYTLDVNLYGKLLFPVLQIDSRQNINPSIQTTWLYRKTDFSFSFNWNEDNILSSSNGYVYDNGLLVSKLQATNSYRLKNYVLSSSIGHRIDSINQLSASFSLSNSDNIFDFVRSNNIQSDILNYNNEIKRSVFNIGYIKTERNGKSMGAAITYSAQPEIQITEKPFLNSDIDSSKIQINSPTNTLAFDYFFNNYKHKKLHYNFGFQSYSTKSKQDYFEFSRLDPLKPFNSNVYVEDSIHIDQFSSAAYFNLVQYYKKNHSFTSYFNVEYYRTSLSENSSQSFLLPTVTLVERTQLKKNKSVKYRLSYDYLKPNIYYLLPLFRTENAFELRKGIANVKPEKLVSFSVEHISASKWQMSNKITANYNYDRLRFITNYDSVNRQFVATATNSSKSYFLGYNISVSRMVSKKFRFFTESSINWIRINNNLLQQNNGGLSFFFTNTANYTISDKAGSLYFYSRAISKLYTDQGSQTGYFNYNLNYGRLFLKNKLAVTIIAENFLLKNRVYNAYYTRGDYDYHTQSIRPYRLFKLRLSYRFSNMVMNKTAEKYSADIRRETSGQLQ